MHWPSAVLRSCKQTTIPAEQRHQRQQRQPRPCSRSNRNEHRCRSDRRCNVVGGLNVRRGDIRGQIVQKGSGIGLRQLMLRASQQGIHCGQRIGRRGGTLGDSLSADTGKPSEREYDRETRGGRNVHFPVVWRYECQPTPSTTWPKPCEQLLPHTTLTTSVVGITQSRSARGLTPLFPRPPLVTDRSCQPTPGTKQVASRTRRRGCYTKDGSSRRR